jgi:hypothetical protein
MLNYEQLGPIPQGVRVKVWHALRFDQTEQQGDLGINELVEQCLGDIEREYILYLYDIVAQFQYHLESMKTFHHFSTFSSMPCIASLQCLSWDRLTWRDYVNLNNARNGFTISAGLDKIN